jgi:hypothetical protein
LLRDQLLQCAETDLRKTLQNIIWADRMLTITVLKLMKEIKKAAVEKQSDLLNKVKLMEAIQKHVELVRTFVARLRGLTNICIFFTDSISETCNKTVSHVDATIHLGPS